MSEVEKSKRPAGRLWLLAAIASFVVVFDQLTKWQVIDHLTRAFEGGASALPFAEKLERFLWLRHPVRDLPVTVFDSWWRFVYVENPGAAWGFLARWQSDARVYFFLGVAVVAMIFIVVYYRKTLPEQHLLRVALALVLGGALGNFLDRVRLGYVIDFIDWHLGEGPSWPTFNIADAGITVGVTLMLLDMLLHRSSEKSAQSPATR